MRADRPSRTALWIARAIVYWSRDPRIAQLVPEGAARTSRWFLEEATGHDPRISLLSRLIANRMGIVIHYLLRKRRIEELAREAIASGFRRVIILGAGFDTLAFRLHREFPDVQFLELDHPATQRVKRAALAKRNAIGPNLRLEPLDLSAEPLPQLAEPALWIAEGVLMYLDAERVRSAFEAMRGRVIFTFMDELRFQRHGWLIHQLLRLTREPLRWAAPASEVQQLQVESPWDLRARYLPRKVDASLAAADGDLLCVVEDGRFRGPARPPDSVTCCDPAAPAAVPEPARP